MSKERIKEWKKKGSYGMLLITEDEIYFCHEAFKTEFDDWDINKGIKLYDRIPRSFCNHTRQSEEMKKAAIEDLLKMGMTIDDDTYIGAFETTMPVVRGVSDLRILREYLQYTLSLSEDCMESILSMKGADLIKWDLHRLKV